MTRTAIDPQLAAMDPALALPRRRKMEILFAVMLVLFLAALDQTIVGVALPRIVGELNGTDVLYTWVVTSYLLAATITGVFYGKLSDIFGRRLILLVGVTIFLVGSALSAVSWSMESLIVFRGIQGAGAGAIFPISLAVIGDLFEPRQRGRYQGLFGAVFGIAAVIGPLLGGWLTDSLGWHWIFLVNLPIGAVAFYIIYRYLPSVHGEPVTRNLDYLGAVVFSVAVVFLLLGLTNKQTSDWAAFEVGGYLLVAAVAGLVFLFIESRAAEPIVPLELFRNRNYSVTVLATFLAAIGFFEAIVFLPRWFLVRQGGQPHRVGPPGPRIAGRPHPRLRRFRHPGEPHGPLQVDRRDCTCCHVCRHPPAYGLDGTDGSARAVGLDVHHRPRHRANDVGLHRGHPEFGAIQPPGSGHRQPDVLPADRRIGRPRDSGHALRAELLIAPRTLPDRSRSTGPAIPDGGPTFQRWRQPDAGRGHEPC